MARAVTAKNRSPGSISSRLSSRVPSRARRGSVVSMTGFGAATVNGRGWQLKAEVKSLNSRHLEVVCKLPRSLSGIEFALRESAAAIAQRGRVEITLSESQKDSRPARVCFNRSLFQQYLHLYGSLVRLEGRGSRTLRNNFSSTASPDASRAVSPAGVSQEMLLHILSRHEVLYALEPEQDELAPLALRAAQEALRRMVLMRQREGSALARDILRRLGRLESLRVQLLRLAHARPALLRQRVTKRLEVISPELLNDPQKLSGEVALLLDRVDVSEELSRLESHFEQFRAALAEKGCGRKADFLLQELGREFNTIGAKVQEASMQHLVVDAKCELEKIREQVQNIE